MDKATLSQYRDNRREILQLREELYILETRVEAPGGTNYSGMPSGKGGTSDPVGNGATALEALRSRYNRKLRELLQQQEEIEAAIARLDDELRVIMRDRYILGYKWEAICARLDDDGNPMDLTTAHRKHRKALQIMAEDV